MPLDVALSKTQATEAFVPASVSFRNDGIYWFSYPFFEQLAHKTGQMIDLYGDAWFARQQLEELETTLSQIIEKALSMPEQWDECIGIQLNPTPQKIHSKVLRGELLELISRFKNLVLEAKSSAMGIMCVGD